MNKKYKATLQYWENAFDSSTTYDSQKPIMDSLEKSIKWLASESETIIDFGCGTGRLLLRCLYYGDVKELMGVDISPTGIQIGRNNATKYKDKVDIEFSCGGVEMLKEIPDNKFDAAILSNILDNLVPEDANILLSEINRIVKCKGKVFIKLNPYLEEEKIKEYNLKELESNLYIDDSELYLWNVCNAAVNHLLDEHFILENYKDIVHSQYGVIGRAYHLTNK